MRGRGQDKMRAGARNKTADDFTAIPGVPAFAARSLHNYGVLTYADLRRADLSWLHPQVREAIERWRDG